MNFKPEFDQMCTAGQVSGPCSASQITAAEEALQITFPKQYRAFLSQYGAVLLNGAELFGLPAATEGQTPIWQNVVTISNQLKDFGQAGHKCKTLIPIAEDGTGVYFYLDTDVAPETRIIAIGYDSERFVSNDLFEFAIALAAGNIKV